MELLGTQNGFGIDLNASLPFVFVIAGVSACLLLLREAYSTNFPKISNIPEPQHALPFVGHMLALGGRQNQNDSTIYSKWMTKTKSNIIQICIGDQRSIVVGSYSMIKDLWVTRAQALIDHPHQPGFLDALGVDITGMPMTPQIRRCRQAAMKALGKPMWSSYYHLLEPSSLSLVQSVLEEGKNGAVPIDIYPYIRRVVFSLALSITYGAKMEKADDEFMIDFLKNINDISAVRASTQSFRHFVPLLRLVPESRNQTYVTAAARQKQVDFLYNQYLAKVDDGETVNCIVSMLGEEKLSLDEIHGTCVSLLQAAPDTIASGVYQCIAWLSSPQGQVFQPEALGAILDAYNGDRNAAWDNAFREEKVPLIVSLYKETLRYWCPTPFAVPRRTTEDIEYNGATIPKGITMIMNAQQANHDKEHYGADAEVFNPYRFIGNNNPLPHMSFGAGSRICPAMAISNRIMGAMLVRIILAFEMTEVEGMRKPNIDMIDFSGVHNQLVAQPRFYDSSFKARDEMWLREKITHDGDTT